MSGNLKKLEAGAFQMGRGIGQVSSGLATLGTRVAIGAAAGLTAVVTTAASFEQAFTDVEKTVDGTDAQLGELEQTLRQMARTIPVSFEELSSIAAEGGALGIARDSLDEFTDVVARLSVSTNLTSEEAATALGQLGTVLHLSGDDFKEFADSLVGLGNAGASTEDQIIALASRFAAAGNAAGLSKEDILALSSATASMGIEVEAGGTALSQTFNGITKAIGTGSDEVKAYTKTLGISAAEFKTRWTNDAIGTFRAFLGELSKLDKYQQADILEQAGITGIRQVNAIQLMTQNLGFFDDQLKIANESQGALDKESQKFFDTSIGQWKVLVGNVRDAAATIGAELLPVANSLIHDFVDKLQEPGSQAALKTFSQDLAAGVRGLVSELKGTDFSGIIGGMKLAAQVAKGAFDAFRSLPAPIQQLAIAALVANKVSGGAIGTIAKGLGNLLLGSLKTIYATQVTVVGTGVTGGGGGIAGEAGGLAGVKKFLPTGLAGWLGFLGIAAADFALITTAVAVWQDQNKNVGVAADFEKGVVSGRSTDATVAELQGLREDLKTQLTTGTGDVISGALKGIFVNPELTKQIKIVDQDILAQSTHIQRGDDIVHNSLLAVGAEDAMTNRLIREARLAEFVKIGQTAASDDRAMLNVTQQYASDQRAKNEAMLVKLGQTANATERTAAKNFSPKFVANITNNVKAYLSVTQALYQQSLYTQIREG